MRERGLDYRNISLNSVQARRDRRIVGVARDRSRAVHEMVPLFLRPLTPMLYRRREHSEQLCFILVKAPYVARDGVECVVCDGNIASQGTRAWYRLNFLDQLPWSVLDSEYWNSTSEGSRQRSAEFLVWPQIPPSEFCKILVKSRGGHSHVSRVIATSTVRIP